MSTYLRSTVANFLRIEISMFRSHFALLPLQSLSVEYAFVVNSLHWRHMLQSPAPIKY